MIQIYAYTEEVIERLNAYAKSIPCSPPVSYPLVHPEVYVPPGYLPIKIAQFFRYDPITWRPHHWSIFIPTSQIPGVGHHYELDGQSPVYFPRSTINNYSVWRKRERGCHTVGYVLPTMLPLLEAHFALVPLDNLRGDWNSQHWVYCALQGLDNPHMFAVKMTLEGMAAQMDIVSAAWERGDVS